MLKQVRTPAILILITFFLVNPFTYCLGKNTENTVSPEVLQYLDSEPFVPVIAFFKKKALPGQDPADMKAASGRAAVEELQRANKVAEEEILPILKEETANGNLRGYKSLWVINAFSAQINKEGLKRLCALPQIKTITLDHRRGYLSAVSKPERAVFQASMFLDEFPGRGKDLFNLQAINVPPLWKEGYFGDGVVVAVMDTGVDLNHPDLEQNYRGNLPGHSHKDSWFDATGTLPNSAEGPVDTHGHGTHITGIIVGGSKEKPLGIAPGARWIAVNIFSDGYAWDSHIALAFQWLLAPGGNPDHAPDIINCSWASRPEFAEDFLHWDILYTLEKAGITVIFASGNNGEEGPGSPASYPHSFCAGALKQAGDRFEAANFSSKGPVRWQDISYIKPDLVAPGVNIVSTWPGKKYAIQDGTSTAAAHLSGAAALLLGAKPDLSPAEIKYLLKSTSFWDPLWDNSGSRPNNVYGYGLPDVYAAVKHEPLMPPELLFFDGAEEGIINWKTSPETPWKITRELAGSGRFSFADSPWEDYNNNTSSWIATAKPILLDGYHSPVLFFQHCYGLAKTEDSEDYAYVEISVDGINWSILYRFSGSNGKLEPFSIPLSCPGEANSLYLRFRIQSDNNGSGMGWHIDDLTLKAYPLPLRALDRLRLTPEKTKIALGEETAVRAEAMFSSRILKEIQPELVTWHSSNPAVARVENGVITGLAPGESIIRGTFNDKSAEFKIAVVEIKPAVPHPDPGTYINTVEISLQAGSGEKITYTLDGTDPHEKSTVYERPIVIDKTSILKTRTYLGTIPGPVSEFSYIIKKGTRITGTIQLQGKPSLNGERISARFICRDTKEIFPVTSFAKDGSFDLNLPLGSYLLVISSRQHLTKVIGIELWEKQKFINLGPIKMLAGDLNNDNKIDLTDLSLLSLAYFTKPGDKNWNSLADLNGDGFVNNLDLNILSQNYGLSGDEAPGH
ncbi:MAG: S8 family serine peptidase [Firmicutes bacterium]|nr:S8 family serine peptidase [Bacillota bacterium]